jgi:hypothetical protein
VVFGGAWLISPLLPSAILVTSLTSLGAALLVTGRCHSPYAPRLPRAHPLRGPARPAKTTWKWSLSSGCATLRWTGSLPCCSLYSRRETRHEIIFCSKSLVRDRKSRSTERSHPAGLSIQIFQVHLLPPPCDHVLPIAVPLPFSRISASAGPYSDTLA